MASWGGTRQFAFQCWGAPARKVTWQPSWQYWGLSSHCVCALVSWEFHFVLAVWGGTRHLASNAGGAPARKVTWQASWQYWGLQLTFCLRIGILGVSLRLGILGRHAAFGFQCWVLGCLESCYLTILGLEVTLRLRIGILGVFTLSWHPFAGAGAELSLHGFLGTSCLRGGCCDSPLVASLSVKGRVLNTCFWES